MTYIFSLLVISWLLNYKSMEDLVFLTVRLDIKVV